MMGQHFWKTTIVVMVFGTTALACSSQSSQENKDLLLCWLRPSCLPSELSSTKETEPKRSTAKTQPPSKKPQAIKSSTKPIVSTSDCQTLARTKVSASKPSLTISYTEPTTSADGSPLTDLASTTIYYDVGQGFIKAKAVPATRPEGGGTVKESIQVPVQSSSPVDTTICVTATNTEGMATVQLPYVPPPAPAASATSPKPSNAPATQSLDCQTLAHTKVSASKPSLTISYTEPTTSADGSPLTDLASTTIYYDVGQGFIKAKAVPATRPEGGGTVKESIQVPVQSSTPVDTTICVTATNTEGMATVQLPYVPPPAPAASATSPKPSNAPATQSLDCQTLAHTKVSASKPSLTISYTEPTTSADGSPLTDLASTTIYYDVGQGFIKAKAVPATRPEGGGTVKESIQVPVQSSTPVDTTICVTATNTEGMATVQLPYVPPPAPAASATSPKPSNAPATQSLDCQTLAHTKVSASKPSLTISYTEPTTSADGSPLTDLASTTIYYDVGQGFIKAKAVPATRPEGGGTIKESIQVPVQSSSPVDTTICVTATNTEAVEN